MPKTLKNFRETCNFYPPFRVKKNTEHSSKILKKSKDKTITVSGIIQREISKLKLGLPFKLISEVGTFYLSASDDLLKLFNSHEWEEFVIKGILIDKVIKVRTAKIKHRSEIVMEDFFQLDDYALYEKSFPKSSIVELEFDVA